MNSSFEDVMDQWLAKKKVVAVDINVYDDLI